MLYYITHSTHILKLILYVDYLLWTFKLYYLFIYFYCGILFIYIYINFILKSWQVKTTPPIIIGLTLSWPQLPNQDSDMSDHKGRTRILF